MRIKYERMNMEIENHAADDAIERIAIAVSNKSTWIDRRITLTAAVAMEFTSLNPEELNKVIKEFGIDDFMTVIKENIDNYYLIEQAIEFYDKPVIALRHILAGIGDAKELLDKYGIGGEETAEEAAEANG